MHIDFFNYTWADYFLGQYSDILLKTGKITLDSADGKYFEEIHYFPYENGFIFHKKRVIY